MDLDREFQTELGNRKSLIYVLEGINKSGKTALARRLFKKNPGSMYLKGNFGSGNDSGGGASKRRGRLHVPDASGDDGWRETSRLYDDCLFMLNLIHGFVRNGRTMIIDGFYPSQVAYSYLNGRDQMDSGLLTSIDAHLADVHGDETTLIWCRANKATLEDRFRNDDEDRARVEEIDELNRRYARIFDSLRVPWMSYDTSMRDLFFHAGGHEDRAL